MVYLYDELKKIKYDDYKKMKDVIERYNPKLIKNYIKYEDRLNNVISKFILISYLYKIKNIKEIESYIEEKDQKPMMKSIKFNISHCSEAIVVAISNNNIGIDVETPILNYSELKNLVLSEKEQKKNLTEIEFRKIWVLKEAYIKYNGRGLSIDLSEINLSEFINENQFIIGDLYYNYLNFNNYSLAICSLEKERIERISYKQLKEIINILINLPK